MKNASDHIGEVLKRVKPEYIARVYKVTSYKDVDDFLEQVANLSGRLLKVNSLLINLFMASGNSKCNISFSNGKFLLFTFFVRILAFETCYLLCYLFCWR